MSFRSMRWLLTALLRPLLYLWAFPATFLGLFFVPLAWLSGGTVRPVQGVLEVHGGLPRRSCGRGCRYSDRRPP